MNSTPTAFRIVSACHASASHRQAVPGFVNKRKCVSRLLDNVANSTFVSHNVPCATIVPEPDRSGSVADDSSAGSYAYPASAARLSLGHYWWIVARVGFPFVGFSLDPRSLLLVIVVWIGALLANSAVGRECLVVVDSASDNLAVVDTTDLVIRGVVRLPSRIAVGCAREAGWPGLRASRIDAVRETGLVAVGVGTCIVHLFDAQRMLFFDSFRIGHPLDMAGVRFTRDGSFLAVTSTPPSSERGGVSLIDMEALQIREVPIPGLSAFGGLVEHPDGMLYAFSGGTLGMYRVDPVSGESSRVLFADEYMFRAIAFSPDVQWLFASAREVDATGQYVVFDLDSGEIVESRESRSVYSDPSGTRIYLVSGDKIEVVDARTRLQIDELDTMGLRVSGLVFSEDESRMFGIVPMTDRAIPYVRIAAFDLENSGVRTLSMDGDHCGRFHATRRISSNPNERCLPVAMRVVRCSCPMDCNDDNRVTVSEIIVGVRLALSEGTIDTCSSADLNRDREISISELISGVRAALNGCE